jgi:predicted outer membrane repeat protein
VHLFDTEVEARAHVIPLLLTSTLTLHITTLTGNMANSGGACGAFGNFDFIGCNFSNNVATASGGALWAGRYIKTAAHPNVTIIRTSFSNNSATLGGAVYSKSILNMQQVRCVLLLLVPHCICIVVTVTVRKCWHHSSAASCCRCALFAKLV